MGLPSVSQKPSFPAIAAVLGEFMAAIQPSHAHEVEELVSQQIQAFKNVAPMDDRDILEYHLRYFRIMALYREMDRIAHPVMQEQAL